MYILLFFLVLPEQQSQVIFFNLENHGCAFLPSSGRALLAAKKRTNSTVARLSVELGCLVQRNGQFFKTFETKTGYYGLRTMIAT